ncbi:MAG: N-acetylmuramoyl-L-alanine amidase family protein [Lachnospiraceae bacterium]|nr:N-acetylmuramoyl-L-alanine amidase family protein [Lachnospiraceae bacterium]
MKDNRKRRWLLNLALAMMLCIFLVPALHVKAAQVIDRVYLGLHEPIEEDAPEYDPVEYPDLVEYYSADYSTDYYQNDVIWYDITGGNLKPLRVGESYFEKGHVYSVTVFLTAKSGYEFADHPFCTINGALATGSKTSDGQLQVDFEFPAAKERIRQIDIQITEPVPGCAPDYNPDLGDSPHCYCDPEWNTETSRNEITWVDVTEDRDLLVDQDVFQEGHTYEVYIHLEAMTDYVFKGEISCKVNGNPVNYMDINRNGRSLFVKYLFKPSQEDGWQKVDGKWYYYEDGKAVIGWKKVSGKWYYFDSEGIMLTGWQKIGGKWYRFTGNGDMITGWKQISGIWYHFGSSGAMDTGWKQISGTGYYFNSSGAMQTGWQTIGGKTYYFKSSGAMAAKEWCKGYWLNADGTWTYKYKASWKKDSKGWYYQDTSGWYAKSTTIKIDDKMYTFDSKGYMK